MPSGREPGMLIRLGANSERLNHAYPVSTDPKNEAKKDSPRRHESTKESQETNNQ
jgi:hypothetical protein